MDKELKDVIIGGASNYDWKKLQYWINSIKKSGFTGDIVVCATNITGDTVKKLRENDIIIQAYGKPTEDGGFEHNSNNAPHVERFIYIWDFLEKNKDKYHHAIVTDTRDVIFQKNPSEWLDANLGLTKSLVASSEGLAYKHEPWGNKNLLDTFGSYLYERYKDNIIYNVGTIAGTIYEVSDLVLLLFQMSINRPIAIVDQAVYNFIVNLEQFVHEIKFTTNKDDWAVQLGTTQMAIESGAGDIGQAVKADSSYLQDYLDVYQDVQPVIEEHQVKNTNGDIYHIVHQWDRISALKEKIEKYYGDDECTETLTFSTLPN
jgi:hypothetical protein